jgi:hypothetical protein
MKGTVVAAMKGGRDGARGRRSEVFTSRFSLAVFIPDKQRGLYGVIPYLSRKKDPIFREVGGGW